MSDKTSDADKARPGAVEVSPETLKLIAELLPAIAGWAEQEIGEPMTSPADVVALSVAVMHERVFAEAHQMLAEAKAREAESRGGAVH